MVQNIRIFVSSCRRRSLVATPVFSLKIEWLEWLVPLEGPRHNIRSIVMLEVVNLVVKGASSIKPLRIQKLLKISALLLLLVLEEAVALEVILFSLG